MTIGSDHLKTSPSDLHPTGAELDPTIHLGPDFFDLSTFAKIIITPSGACVRANPAMADLFGRPLPEFPSIRFEQLIFPDDRNAIMAELCRLAVQEIDQISVDVRSVNAAGKKFWTRQHIAVLQPHQRGVEHILVQVEDISELRALSIRLERQYDYERTLIDHLPGIIIGSFDKNLRYQTLEGLALEEHGVSQEAFLGKTPWEIRGNERGAEIAEHFRAVLAGESRSYPSEFGGRFYETRVVPKRDEEGTISSGTVIYVDVTDLRIAEIARQRRSEIYRAIVRNLPGAVAAIFDTDLRYIVVDGHGLGDLNLTPEMIEGKTALEFWDPEGRDLMVQHLRATIEGNPQSYEEVINGRHYEIRTVPIRDADGTIELGVVINYDITERKASEREREKLTEALEKSNHDLAEFASVAAHDLRAPLVTINGLATILAEDYQDKLDEEGRHLLDRIIVNSDKMQTLLGELLEISRLGRSETDFVPVDLAAVINHVREQQHFSLDRHKAELVVNVGSISLLANRTRMVQLFGNLVDNAVKYTPRDRTPRIEITATDEGDFWLVAVADNGVGISGDHQTAVFEMFQRLPDGQKLNPKGTGMGLALVERIVKLHGGSVWIDPDTEVGTTFCIRLPKLGLDDGDASL